MLAQIPSSWALHVPPLLALLAGLILWCAGGKMLKLGVILTGLMLGGLLGATLGLLLSPGLGPLIGLLLGVLIGGVLATVFYRIFLGLTFGLGTALACAVIGLALAGGSMRLPAAVLDDQPDDLPNGLGGEELPLVAPNATPIVTAPLSIDIPAEPGPNPNDVEKPANEPNHNVVAGKNAHKHNRPRATQTHAPDPDFPGGPASGDEPPAPAHNKPPADTTKPAKPWLDPDADPAKFLTHARHDFATWWKQIDEHTRTWVLGAGLLGLIVGTLAGVLMPARAATILTAAVGSALWMPATLWLTRAAGFAWPTPGMIAPLAWVMAWVALTLVGVALQTAFFPGTPKLPHAPAKGRRRAST